jgi:hypothetical protein
VKNAGEKCGLKNAGKIVWETFLRKEDRPIGRFLHAKLKTRYIFLDSVFGMTFA